MSTKATHSRQTTGQPTRMVRADDVDVRRANRQLKQAIAQGANGIAMVFEGAHNAYSYGLPVRDNVMEELFDAIVLDGLHVRLDNHPHGSALSNQFVEFLQRNYVHPQRTKMTFGIDPTATLATCGKLKMSIAALKASLPQSMSAFFASGLPGIVLEADGRPYHNAGADVAQELGAILAVADEHLNMIEAGRHPIAHALPHIGFATALTGGFYQSVVKLRTLQNLWQRLQRGRGIAQPLIAPIHVETSRRMLGGNLVLNQARNQGTALAAMAGGAASLSILPPSTVFGLPNEQARSNSLVSQIVLELDNPGVGDYISYSENEELLQRAWAHYQDFTHKGGVMACLMDGSLAQQLSKTHEQRLARRGGHFNLDIFANDSIAADIYEQAPHEPEIDGIEHCQPLTPVFT